MFFGAGFADGGHKGEAAIVAALRPIHRFVQHLDRCTFPVVQHGPSPQYCHVALQEYFELV